MIIKKVKVDKEIVTIILDNKESFKITSETYLNNHLLIDEEITQKEIDKLVKNSQVDIVKLELLKKLSRKHLSIKESEQFLLDRGLESDDIKKIIIEYKGNHLLNDEELAEAIVEHYVMNKKGRNVIRNKLIERMVKGNYDAYLDKYIDKNEYHDNILYLVEKYSKLAKNKSNAYLKKYVESKLISSGYDKEEFSFVEIKGNNDELENVRKEIKKFFSNKEKNNENKTKIVRKLLSKGFNYDIIKTAIGESEADEIN